MIGGYQDENVQMQSQTNYGGNYNSNSYGPPSFGNHGDRDQLNINRAQDGGGVHQNFEANQHHNNYPNTENYGNDGRYYEQNNHNDYQDSHYDNNRGGGYQQEKYGGDREQFAAPPQRSYDGFPVDERRNVRKSPPPPLWAKQRDEEERSRSRDRDRRRSRSRDRSRRGSRSRSPTGSRSRSRNRTPERRRRDRSRGRSRDRPREKSRFQQIQKPTIDRERERDQDSSSSSHFDDERRRKPLSAPSQSIIIHNFHLDATESDIKTALQEDGLTALNISVIRERNSESRGFAFVDFETKEIAEEWINKRKKKALVFFGQRATMDFGRRKQTRQEAVHAEDWTCSSCKGFNFGSRNKPTDTVFICFNCKAIRGEETQQANSDSSRKYPATNVLMLRGLAHSTAEETIRTSVEKLSKRKIYDVRLIRDQVTDLSRGFAFVEFADVEDARELKETLDSLEPPYEIDGYRVACGYAKGLQSNNKSDGPPSKDQPRKVSKYRAAMNAMAQANAVASSQQFSQNVHGTYPPASSTGTPSTGPTATSNNTVAKGFTYDPASGYYYDASTGFYYDSNTGYYYNGTTSQWLQWDGTKYNVVKQDGTVATPQQTQQTPIGPVPPQQIQQYPTTPAQQQQQQQTPGDALSIGAQKPKSARKIAKDMERWAKKLNNQSETKKAAVKQAQDELRALELKEEELRKKIQLEKSITSNLEVIASNKDGIRSLFVPDNDEEGNVLKLGSALNSSSATSRPRNVSLVADYPLDEDDDNDDDVIVDEKMFVDLTKMACLLCQRQLNSQENLNKHLEKSQLHKQNLEKFKESKKRKR